MTRAHGRGFALAATLALASLGGCSLFGQPTQVVQVTATDPTAEITIDGAFVGKGAGTSSLARDRTHTVMARAGDRVGTAVIDRKISTTGILDLVGTLFFLFPILGVLGDGFWDLSPQTLMITLPPAPAAPPSTPPTSGS